MSALSSQSIDAVRQQSSSKGGIYIKTFGCQMNEYDSEKMLKLLSDKYEPTASPESADLVIVNTCSVREKAEHKLFSLLGTLSILKEQRPEMIIGVSGCVAQQEGKNIISRSPSVDFVVGTHNLSLVPQLVKQAKLDGAKPAVAIDYREEWEELPDEFDASAPDLDEAPFSKSAFATPVRALVAIQRGCNKMCAFCVVPNTRGPQTSRDPEEILKEVRLKVRLGAREVMLLGQTVNSYGVDLSPRYPFERLIRKLAQIEGLERIRFTSPHPAEVKQGFIDLYGDVKELCPHIHLPLQSGSDRILKLMNRNYRRKRYLDIVAALKDKCPDLAISADIIVGFPTETEQDFEQTLEVMREVRYSSVYSFIYSRRPGTKALEEFSKDQEVAPEVAKQRLSRLQALQEDICLQINKKRVGSRVEVLVEKEDRKISSIKRGRIAQNTLVELDDSTARVGELVAAVVKKGNAIWTVG